MHRRTVNLNLRLLTLLGTIVAVCSGCDPQLKAAVEDGIISSSTSLITAFLRAGANVILDPNNTSQ